MEFLDQNTITSDGAYAIYGAEPWLFALLQARMHLVWIATVGGRMKTDYRYSAGLTYNTFPVPPLSQDDRDRLTSCAFDVVNTRERYSDRTLGELYFPELTPRDLQRVHEKLDATVDALYSAPRYADRHRAPRDPLRALRGDDRRASPPPRSHAESRPLHLPEHRLQHEDRCARHARDAGEGVRRAGQPVPPAQGPAGVGQVARADVPRARQALQPGSQEGDRRGPRALDRRVVRQHAAQPGRVLRRLGGAAGEQPLLARLATVQGRCRQAVPRRP